MRMRTDLQVLERGHHDLRVVRVQEVSEAARALRERGEHECAVADRLAAGRREADACLRRGREDCGGLGERARDERICDDARALLVGLADAAEEHDLLLRARVLLVDTHDVQEVVNGQVPRGGEACNPRIVHGHGQVVRLERADEAADGDLAEHAARARDLGLEDDANGDRLAVENRGREDGLERVPDGVSEVDEVAEPGLALVDGDDVRLDADRGLDDMQEQLLLGRARVLSPA
jgi:hypothetical protein